MNPILYNLPNLSQDQFCTPSSTANQYYCFYNKVNGTFHNRCTIAFVGDGFKCILKQNNQYGYDISQYPVTVEKIEMYPDLAYFWFPLISSIMVALIFFFIYKILFKRFIK